MTEFVGDRGANGEKSKAKINTQKGISTSAKIHCPAAPLHCPCTFFFPSFLFCVYSTQRL